MSSNANIEHARGERRRWHRYQFMVPVRLRIEKGLDATLMNTHACHMNDGGIAIYANAELSIGTQVGIEFTPPSFDCRLRLIGLVRNRAGSQYGVEFLVTSAAEKEHLILFQQILHTKVGCLDA